MVLGLITTKSPKKIKKQLLQELREVGQIRTLRLCLSVLSDLHYRDRNKLTEEEQWAKLRLRKRLVEEV